MYCATPRNEASLHVEAVLLARRLGLKAAYDAHYLAWAERTGAEFWTADRRLVNQVAPSLPWVRETLTETQS